MAGDWIKMRCDLAGDPAVISIAAATDLDEDTVVGKLHRLWVWADSQTVDGHARVTLACAKRFVDRHVGVTGFADAMVDAGWLVMEEHEMRFPDFDRHNGQTGKRRALTAKRSADYRSRKRNAGSVTECAPREEKRREERKKKESESVSVVVPDILETTDFRSAWNEWRAYRHERRLTMTPRCLNAQLAKLAGFGVAGAILAIRESIAGGWQGVFEPKSRAAGKQPPPDDRPPLKVLN